MTPQRIRLDWTVSIGHLASVGFFVATMAIAWQDLRRNDQEHADRLDRLEAALAGEAAELDDLADTPRRIVQLEATAARNVERLNSLDVFRGELNAKLAAIAEGVNETRDELRAMNERMRP